MAAPELAQPVVEMDAGAQEWLRDYVTQFMKSRSWAGPIKQFVDDHCGIFDATKPEENSLEYTEVHESFKELVDSLLAAHLLEVDITPDAFADSYDAIAQADPAFGEITEQLVSVSDFMVFKNMLLARSRSLMKLPAEDPVPLPPRSLPKSRPQPGGSRAAQNAWRPLCRTPPSQRIVPMPKSAPRSSDRPSLVD
eukprot:TRINITY_DN92882_c0_g1_i1.p1 TRINITY_DN92882_c0_g1~~TRINITY_DN92882_c0_g1_i1.p1  ORF type:complete len:195 (+),score=26.87 TRINITY_DN92882_c0_g1_i1:47-631(+)